MERETKIIRVICFDLWPKRGPRSRPTRLVWHDLREGRPCPSASAAINLILLYVIFAQVRQCWSCHCVQSFKNLHSYLDDLGFSSSWQRVETAAGVIQYGICQCDATRRRLWWIFDSRHPFVLFSFFFSFSRACPSSPSWLYVCAITFACNESRVCAKLTRKWTGVAIGSNSQ